MRKNLFVIVALFNLAFLCGLFNIILILLRFHLWWMCLLFSLISLCIVDLVFLKAEKLVAQIGTSYGVALLALTCLYAGVTLLLGYVAFISLPTGLYVAVNTALLAAYLFSAQAFIVFGKKSVQTETLDWATRELEREKREEINELERLLKSSDLDCSPAMQSFLELKECLAVFTPLKGMGNSGGIEGEIEEKFSLAKTILSEQMASEYEKLPDVFANILFLLRQREKSLIK